MLRFSSTYRLQESIHGPFLDGLSSRASRQIRGNDPLRLRFSLPATGSFGPFTPKEENQKMGCHGGQKESKMEPNKSYNLKSQYRLCLTLFGSFAPPFWIYSTPGPLSGARGLANLSSDFFLTLGSKGPHDRCSRPKRSKYYHRYEARNDYTKHSQTDPLCKRCVRNWKISSQIILV